MLTLLHGEQYACDRCDVFPILYLVFVCRAFLFLCHSGNGEALLLIAALEAATVGSKSAQAVPVVQALKEYTLKNGFEHVRQKASNCVVSQPKTA